MTRQREHRAAFVGHLARALACDHGRRTILEADLVPPVERGQALERDGARVLAERTIRDGGADAGARIRLLFLRALSREPDADEARILTSLATDLRAAYEKEPAAGEELLKHGAWPRPRDVDPRELAAWTAVASSVINLDEMVTRE